MLVLTFSCWDLVPFLWSCVIFGGILTFKSKFIGIIWNLIIFLMIQILRQAWVEIIFAFKAHQMFKRLLKTCKPASWRTGSSHCTFDLWTLLDKRFSKNIYHFCIFLLLIIQYLHRRLICLLIRAAQQEFNMKPLLGLCGFVVNSCSLVSCLYLP